VDVKTWSFFFACLSLACIAGVVTVIVGALVRRFGGDRDRFGGLVTDLRRAALSLAWVVAATSMLGSLYFSEVAKFVPCKLCWYQRICMYPLALILLIAAIRRDRGVRFYAGPLAAVGLVIAAYHTWIQAYPPTGGTSFCTLDAPCTERYVWEFGFVGIPFMALTGFAFILTMMVVLRSGGDVSDEDALGETASDIESRSVR